MVKIIHLAVRRSYLVIIYANLYDKFIKNKIGLLQITQVKCETVQIIINVTHVAHIKSYLLIIGPNYHKSLINSKLYIQLVSLQIMLKITRPTPMNSHLVVENFTKCNIMSSHYCNMMASHYCNMMASHYCNIMSSHYCLHFLLIYIYLAQCNFLLE